MSGASITMMIISMVILWGGLALAIVNLVRSDARRGAGAGADPGPDAGPGGEHFPRDL